MLSECAQIQCLSDMEYGGMLWIEIELIIIIKIKNYWGASVGVNRVVSQEAEGRSRRKGRQAQRNQIRNYSGRAPPQNCLF